MNKARIIQGFINDCQHINPHDISYLSEDKQYIKFLEDFDKQDKTKSEISSQESTIIPLANSLFNELDALDDESLFSDKVEITSELLNEPKYTEISDEDFYILACQVATYIDSYQYWSENIAEILDENGDIASMYERLPNGRRPFWDSVKRYAYADAVSAVETGIGCCFLGALDAAAIFVGAGVGSWGKCAEDLITGDY